ncbi:2-hydroxyacid dehydrogenase [Oscillibacter sp. MSJ-2]|uniref:2-hydroxyacid dehydrogenase n=1 Tax=Dysosmobacter acutus TaxID=2841504 RepID=A0ABS6F9I2_9FIRM|nr:2-hydroxyacid dehydrogenase [Dysosmobacter acutus]MBU5626020.1 2-hydroxyacid dehydrogenase [Dysosmobacter acutus]
MKLLILGKPDHYLHFMPDLPITRQVEAVYRSFRCQEEELAEAGEGAEVLCINPTNTVTASLMDRLPQLKLIQSEGVGFDRVDLKAAAERNIYVCNAAGCNATAVAEQAVLLMLMLLRHAVPYDKATREGQETPILRNLMLSPLTELGQCAVGLVGFGSIAREVARRLNAFGCTVYYNAPHRRAEAEERSWGVTYLPLEELAERSDIVSLHCPANDSTRNLVDSAFLGRMKPTAYLINTARGDVVDSQALRRALLEGRLAGAGIDTLSPEPVPRDHPLIDIPDELRDKIVYSPHIAGVTRTFFLKGHRMLWENVARIAAGERPAHIVNGL